MYSRATNLPRNFDHITAGLTTRAAVKDYYWQANYPMRGGRIGIDATHTLAGLVPRATGSNGVSQPSFGWYMMDESHIVSNHVVEYYRLTGDMAALDYAHSMGEHIKTFLPPDMLDGDYDTLPTTFPEFFAVRTIAWPILSLVHAYRLTDDNEYLTWAIEAAKILDSAQDKDRGWYSTVDTVSLAQYSKAVLALGALYDETSEEKYLDIAEGNVNWATYYIADPNTHYLTGYGYYDANDASLTYAQARAYYDSTHHLDGPAVVWDSSSTRLYYMYAYLYKMTGKSIYKTLMDTAYNLGNGSNPTQVHVAASPWSQLYLATRYNNESVFTNTEITPTVVNNGGGSWTLSWTVPEGVKSYRIKYSDKPIVDQIVYPDESGVKVNYWAAENISSEPTPGSVGTTQSTTLIGLAVSGVHFSVRGMAYSAVGVTGCSDSIQNGDETGVDCGGSCPNACSTPGVGVRPWAISGRSIAPSGRLIAQ